MTQYQWKVPSTWYHVLRTTYKVPRTTLFWRVSRERKRVFRVFCLQTSLNILVENFKTGIVQEFHNSSKGSYATLHFPFLSFQLLSEIYLKVQFLGIKHKRYPQLKKTCEITPWRKNLISRFYYYANNNSET